MGFINSIKAYLGELIGLDESALVKCEADKNSLNNQLQTANNFGQSMQTQNADLKNQVSTLTASKSAIELVAQENAAKVTDLQKKVASLENQVSVDDSETILPAPEWLDSSKMAYQPIIRTADGMNMPVSIFPTEIYCQSLLLKNRFSDYIKALGINDFSVLSKFQKLELIWKFTIDTIEYDSAEIQNLGTYSWQTHIVSIERKLGDCNDGTCIFLDLCRMIGIDAASAFNNVGMCTFGYHSFPVIWFNSDELKGTTLDGSPSGWYIYETTLSGFYPAAPERLQGSSSYFVDTMANWRNQGTPMPDYQKAYLNGYYPGAVLKTNKIEHSIEKRKKIMEHWRSKPGKDAQKNPNALSTSNIPDFENQLITLGATLLPLGTFLDVPAETAFTESPTDFITDASIIAKTPSVNENVSQNGFFGMIQQSKTTSITEPVKLIVRWKGADASGREYYLKTVDGFLVRTTVQ